jgi:serine/threonine-protein kinase
MYENAIGAFRSSNASALLGHACARAGYKEEARTILGQLSGAYARALVELGMNEIDHAIDGLEQACIERYPHIVYLGIDPIFDPLRENPRFRQLLTRMHL